MILSLTHHVVFAFRFATAVNAMVGQTGLEPVTPRLSSACSNQLSYRPLKAGGGNRVRTDDILLAKQTLYQLSYTPVCYDGLFDRKTE